MTRTSRTRGPRAGALLLAVAALLAVAVVTVDGLRFPRTPAPTVDAPVTLQALLERGSQERHTLYAFLRAEAPGARIVLDTSGPVPGVSPTSLRSLGAVGRIDRVALGDGPLGPGWIPDDEPDLIGRLRETAWELHREPGPLDTVLIGARDGRTVLVDRRSVPALGLPAWDRGAAAPAAPSLVRAVTAETMLLLGLLLIGGLVLPRRLGTTLTRPSLALLAGVAVQAVGAYLFLAGSAAMAGGLVLASAVGWWLRRRGVPIGWSRADLPALGIATAVLAATALAVRLQGLVVVTADAIAHVERAIAIGSGAMGLADLDEKRPLALAVVQAPAHALGIEGLHGLGWALLVAATVLLTRLVSSGTPTEGRWGAVGPVAGAVVLVLVPLVPMLRTMAAFLNTHLLVAVLLLLLTLLWMADDEGRAIDLAPVGAAALLAIVPARAESVLLVGLVLLATLAVRTDAPAWPWAWPVVGGGLTVWNGLHVVAALDAGTRPSFPVATLTSVGVVTLLAGPFVLRLPTVARRTLALGAMGGLWLLLIGLLTSTIGSGSGALDGLRVNLGEGAGAWGVLAPLLVVLVVAALVVGAARPDTRTLLARWLTVGAVPSVLLAKAADGTERVMADGVGAALDTLLVLSARTGSWGDSANRMWSHFLLVALALVIVTLARAAQGDDDGHVEDRAHGRSSALRSGAVAVVGLLVVALALGAWRPAYLGPPSPGGTAPVVTGSDPATSPVSVALIEGTRVEGEVVVPRTTLPDDAVDVAVCVTFRLTDLGRIVTGTTRFGLAGPSATAVRESGEFARSGDWTEELCLAAPEVAERPVTLTAWAEGGVRATVGGAAVLLARPDGLPVDSVEVRYVAASEDPRAPLLRLASGLLRIAIEDGPTGVAVLVGVGLVLLLVPRSVARRMPRPSSDASRRAS